jgi:aminoglycoside phosphotransferase (APT) family kinase protein
MLDYNAKFDRRESTKVLEEGEIRELVRSHLGSGIESVSVLTGGFVNSNYRLVVPDHPLVLRIAARPGDLKKELRVLRHVQDAVPVPAVVAEDFSGPSPFALLEFIEGRLLSDSMSSLDAVDLTRVGFEAGISLQAIHSFDLGKAGFFDENFMFDPAFENFGGGLYDYI